MERSGNFYKAIRLGYILISILIGCMAYNSLYEWQEIEALELGNKTSNETYGLEYFIPKQKVLRTVKGKKVFFMVPVIHSLVFVHASHQKIVDFKHNYYYDLQFVTWKSGGELVYLTVPDEDMTNFIKVCKQADEEVHFYKISEINKEKDKINIEKGKRVRVHGGPFDQVEGYFIKVAKKRGRQLVVIIPDLLAVSAEVKPEYIQIID